MAACSSACLPPGLCPPIAEVSKLPVRCISSAGRPEGRTEDSEALQGGYNTHPSSFQTFKGLSHAHLTEKFALKKHSAELFYP